MKSSRSLSMREKLRCPKVMVPTQTFLPCHLWVMGIQEGCLPRATLHRPTCILPTLRLPTLPSRWGGFPHSKQESLRWVVCLPRDTLLILTLLLDPPCQGLIAMEFLCMGLFQASQLILNSDLVNNHLNNKGVNHCLKVDNSSNNREVSL